MEHTTDPNTYKLLTPGPLTTTLSVRQAMLVDRCTWDNDYKAMTQKIREQLLALAHVDASRYTTVLMQGSGTFGVESVLSSLPKPTDHVLVLVNGAYSERMCTILATHGQPFSRLDLPWDQAITGDVVANYLKAHPEVTMVALVHNETTTGVLNDLESVAAVVKAQGATLIVDAMSSFGGIDIDVGQLDIDALISSANKCIQGVPGFSFIIVKRDVLKACQGYAKTLSLNLYDQWQTLEKEGGKWRFTSPTHAVAAFAKALDELEREGGVTKRAKRYQTLNATLRAGMVALGFTPFVTEKDQGPIITTFTYPDEHFDFKALYEALKANGYVIYPGKLTDRPSFRIGNIGDLTPDDVARILSLMRALVAREAA